MTHVSVQTMLPPPLVHVWSNFWQPVGLYCDYILHLIPATAALLNLEKQNPLWLGPPQH